MGQREPWRAQFVTWSRVVRAYWRGDLGGGCSLGRGTSRRVERSIEEASRGVGVIEVGVERGRVAIRDEAGVIRAAVFPHRRARARVVVDNIAEGRCGVWGV